MGSAFSARHASVLCSQLRRESRSGAPAVADPWGPTDYLLANIEFYLHVLAWRGTEDAKLRANVPQPIEPPLIAMGKAREDARTDPAEVAAALGVTDRL